MTTLENPGFDMNVTSFTLPEVRIVTTGEYAVFLLPLARLVGDDMPAKIASVGKMGKQDFPTESDPNKVCIIAYQQFLYLYIMYVLSPNHCFYITYSYLIFLFKYNT